MVAQIVENTVLGSRTFQLHSVAEIFDEAWEAALANEVVVVFVHRVATGKYVVAQLEKDRNTKGTGFSETLDVRFIDGSTPADRRAAIVKALHNREFDVLVATDSMSTGWRAPEFTRAVLHAELPTYGGSFYANMVQREGRKPQRGMVQ